MCEAETLRNATFMSESYTPVSNASSLYYESNQIELSTIMLPTNDRFI